MLITAQQCLHATVYPPNQDCLFVLPKILSRFPSDRRLSTLFFILSLTHDDPEPEQDHLVLTHLCSSDSALSDSLTEGFSPCVT